MRMIRKGALLFIYISITVWLGATAAMAQAVGGNASLSVTGTSSNVALPASISTYPSVLITPPVGTTTEVFYAFGTANTVAATTSSPSLPSGGICFANVGPNSYIAGITGGGSATLRITQLAQCPPGFASAGSGGGGTVTSIATSCGVSGGTITTTGTISSQVTPNNVSTDSAYAFVATDCGKIVRFTDSTPRAPTLNVALFSQGNFINIKNDGTGTQTITPSSGTINGASSFAIPSGGSNTIVYDQVNTNWITSQVAGTVTPGGSSGQLQTNNGAGGFGAVAAPAGTVVGTTDSQTLTNKSIAGSEVNSGTVPLAQMPTLFGMPPYITGASMWYGNPYSTGIPTTSPTGSANQYLCAPFWITQSVTIKALGIRVVATSAGNTSVALQGAVYADLLTTGNVHRPGTLIDYADGGGGFATGVATSVSSTMHNTTDLITGPAVIWSCVQKFDATATYAAISSASSNIVTAAIGEATLANTGLSNQSATGVGVAGTGFGGVNWINFNSSTAWSETVSAAPMVAIQVN